MSGLLEQVLQFLREGAYGSLPLLFPGLIAHHQDCSESLGRFALLYPGEKELLAAWESDLSDYQNAVGALVEQAWADAEPLWEEVSRNFGQRRAAAERVRLQQGYSGLPALDEFAWSLHRGRPDGRELLQQLRQAENEVSQVAFPDPRLTSEWKDLWAPLGRELIEGLQTAPHLGLLPRLEEFFHRHRHWLRRARQRRDYSAIPWWQQLREQLTTSQALTFDSAASWLDRDFSDWPEADRQLRLRFARETRDWLERLRDHPDSSPASEWVAFGDLHYDRWLWLFQAKA